MVKTAWRAVLMMSIICILITSISVFNEAGIDTQRNYYLTASAAPAVNEKHPETTPENAWLTGWGQRIKLTISHANIDTPLVNFPVMIFLSTYSGTSSTNLHFIFDELENDDNRKKIAVTTADGETQCYVEVERWSTATREAWLWVKVPFISDTVDTELFFYYDKNQFDNTEMVGDTQSVPAENVWDDNFKMVLHLGESSNGTIGEFKDSSGIGHHATGSARGNSKFPEIVSGRIGDGQLFENNYIEVPDSDDFSPSCNQGLTVSFWVSPGVLNMANRGDYTHYLGKCDSNQNEWIFRIYNKDETDRPQRVSFYVFNLEGGLGAGAYSERPIEVNEWLNITGRIDQDYIYFYRNGVLAGQSRYTTASGDIPSIELQNGTAPLRIGTGDLRGWFIGRIDEVRLSNVSRPSAWIKAGYYSESDRLIEYSDFIKSGEMFAAENGPGQTSISCIDAEGDAEREADVPAARSYLIYIIIAILVLIAITTTIVLLYRHHRFRKY